MDRVAPQPVPLKTTKWAQMARSALRDATICARMAEERRSVQSWRLPLLTGLALAIVTAVPYAFAYIVQPQGHVFMGFFYLGDDANTYLAKMR